MPLVLAVWSWLHPDFMAVVSAVVGVLTLIVATWIALRQTAITKRQGEIAELQHAAEQKRARLDVRAVKSKTLEDGTTVRYALSIANDGTRTCKGAVYAVVIRLNLHPKAKLVSMRGDEIESVDGRVANKHLLDTLAPDTQVTIGYCDIEKGAEQELRIYWKVSCEDGVFPPHGVNLIAYKDVQRPFTLKFQS